MRNSFFGHSTPIITPIVEKNSTAEVMAYLPQAVAQGATGFAIGLQNIPREERTKETFLRWMDAAPEQPFMFLLYRSDSVWGDNDDARQTDLLTAARAGAEVIDVMGDLYDPSPYELTLNPEAIARQKELIAQIHAIGSKVIISSHIKEHRSADQVLTHLCQQQERGADIVKIVTTINTEAELSEAIDTLFLLKKQLHVPYVFLANGHFGRLFRYIGTQFGVAISFSTEKEGTSGVPSLEHLRTIIDTITYPTQQ